MIFFQVLMTGLPFLTHYYWKSNISGQDFWWSRTRLHSSSWQHETEIPGSLITVCQHRIRQKQVSISPTCLRETFTFKDPKSAKRQASNQSFFLCIRDLPARKLLIKCLWNWPQCSSNSTMSMEVSNQIPLNWPIWWKWSVSQSFLSFKQLEKIMSTILAWM